MAGSGSPLNGASAELYHSELEGTTHAIRQGSGGAYSLTAVGTQLSDAVENFEGSLHCLNAYDANLLSLNSVCLTGKITTQ